MYRVRLTENEPLVNTILPDPLEITVNDDEGTVYKALFPASFISLITANVKNNSCYFMEKNSNINVCKFLTIIVVAEIFLESNRSVIAESGGQVAIRVQRTDFLEGKRQLPFQQQVGGLKQNVRFCRTTSITATISTVWKFSTVSRLQQFSPV